jgi:lipopolysaccharide/colanic/teichoic acid biosynthesis glycosyltransferase
MTLVGPRWEQLVVVERYRLEHLFQLYDQARDDRPDAGVRPRDLRFEERLDVERGYIQHPTLGRDLHIIDLTLSAIVRGDGAY